MIYLDTNIFLHPILGNDNISEACINILQKISFGEIEAGTSTLTWDEFIHVTRKKKGREKANEEAKTFLSTPNLIFFEANEEVIAKAQTLSETYNINPRDAIHAATAIVNNCAHIVSDDSDFDKLKEIKRMKI